MVSKTPERNDRLSSTKRNVEACAEELCKHVPPSVGTIIKTSTPYVILSLDLMDKSWPYVVKGYVICQKGYVQLEPYHPEKWLPMITGIIMCFFGGSYLVLIAAVEAFRQTGYSRLSQAGKILYENSVTALEASRKDDLIDANNDGVADVSQITQSELLSRKIQIIMKAVEPEKVSEALGAFWAGIMAVIATLRLTFINAVTLGSSLGEIFHKYVGEIAVNGLTEALPEEYKKWAPCAVSYSVKFIGVSIAWILQRFIFAVHSAIRGGQMFANNLAIYLKEHNNTTLSDKSIQGISILVAGLGIMWQLNHGFSLPFPLSILLLPVTIIETLLIWTISFV